MYEVYSIMDGETIDDVAKKFEASKGEIYQLNGFDEAVVFQPGMMIVVPRVKKNNFWYYTVKKGDNIYNFLKNIMLIIMFYYL